MPSIATAEEYFKIMPHAEVLTSDNVGGMPKALDKIFETCRNPTSNFMHALMTNTFDIPLENIIRFPDGTS